MEDIHGHDKVLDLAVKQRHPYPRTVALAGTRTAEERNGAGRWYGGEWIAAIFSAP
jgi:hypothetical protein